jgi:hypothetical protein
LCSAQAESSKLSTRSGRSGLSGKPCSICPPHHVIKTTVNAVVKTVDISRIGEYWGEADTIGMLAQMGVDLFVGRMEELAAI